MLPSRPNLDHLRRQAKDLVRGAQAGEPRALERIRAVSDDLTLAAAQLALAREYGFSSWRELKEETESRTGALAGAFVVASIRGPIEEAARLLAENPELASFGVITALVLGDVDFVRAELERDPAIARERDPSSGWTAMQAVCSSRWHAVDPARAEGLAATARLLLDAGADVGAASGGRGRGRWSPLRCVVASANVGSVNEPVLRLVLEHGARPDDHDVYLAAFAGEDHRCLRLLLEYADADALAGNALAGVIGARDLEGVRLVLEAGADPRRYLSDHEEPHGSALYDAIVHRVGLETVERLLARGADPATPGVDGVTPFRLALASGQTELASLLARYGAADDSTTADRLLSAARRGEEAVARSLLEADPGLVARMSGEERGAVVRAAEAGDAGAVELMLDLGLPIDARGEDGATPLHAAAFAGSLGVVRLLIARGADLEAVDSSFQSTPLDWAAVGSGLRPDTAPDPDWLGCARALLEAGASTAGIELTPGGAKAPSGEVAGLLRGWGVGEAGSVP